MCQVEEGGLEGEEGIGGGKGRLGESQGSGGGSGVREKVRRGKESCRKGHLHY